MWAHRDRGSRYRACKGLPLVYIYVMAASLVYGIPNNESGLSLTLLPTFGTDWVALSSIKMGAFALSCTLLCRVWILSLGGLKRIGGGVQLGERGDRRSGGEETVVGMTV